jgi:hypothetical protein
MTTKGVPVTTAALTPGTREWLESAPSFVAQALACIRRELRPLPKLIAELRDQEVWTKMGMRDWEQFCAEYLKVPPEFVAALMELA